MARGRDIGRAARHAALGVAGHDIEGRTIICGGGSRGGVAGGRGPADVGAVPSPLVAEWRCAARSDGERHGRTWGSRLAGWLGRDGRSYRSLADG